MPLDDRNDDDKMMTSSNSVTDDPATGPGVTLSPAVFSLDAERMRELESTGILTRIDLDLAYCTEKLMNLDVLLFNVSGGVTEYEALAMETEDISHESFEKSLQFDRLSAIFDSEVRELDNFMCAVQMDVVEAHEKLSSVEHMQESFRELERKLEASEESLKQLQDHISEMRTKSAKFQSIIDCCRQESWHNEVLGFPENSLFSPRHAEVKMQTTEQQRHVLRMLEKSLARELELENKLSESKNNEEELLGKLSYKETEIYAVEEAAETAVEASFEAQNAAEVLTGISKELINKLHLAYFNFNSSAKRESETRSKVDALEQQLQEMSVQLDREKSSASAHQEQQATLYSKIGNLESVIVNLEEKLLKAETKCDIAEAQWQLLAETNAKLNDEVALLKSRQEKLENIESLEKQLKQSDTHLQHAKALVEASQEKQSMLYSALSDMGNLIEDLKTKVSRAESRADSAEAKCILLTETNLEHNEELVFLRGRVECLEASMRREDDTKMATAGEIDIHAKSITNMLMQLAMERERLQMQISSLAKENKILLGKCWTSKSNSSVATSEPGNDNGKESDFSRNDVVATQRSESFGEAMAESSTIGFQVENHVKERPGSECEVGDAVSVKDDIEKLDAVRMLDAGQLNSKYIIVAILLVLLSVFAVYLFQEDKPQSVLITDKISTP